MLNLNKEIINNRYNLKYFKRIYPMIKYIYSKILNTIEIEYNYDKKIENIPS